jgi:hypothetical protein
LIISTTLTLLNIFLDNLSGFFKRVVTVAHPMLNLLAKLGKGLVKFRYNKKRVIAKTAAAYWLKADKARTLSLNNPKKPVLIRKRYRTDIKSPALVRGQTVKQLKELSVVLFVALIPPGKAGGVDPGRAVQSLNAKA